MKISKRVLSLLLLLVFVLSSVVSVPVFASNFSDVDDSEKYAGAVTFLNALGVINGYEDGTFKPLNNVSRAEFTAMLMRYRGYGDVGSTALENPPYPDVTSSDVSWAIGNIRTAQSMGIINGYEDGTFRPQNSVLFEEAIKMIVCSIGYENYSAEGLQWYNKYITTATKLGILKNADGAVGTPATRSCIAQLLYNCNDVDVVDISGSTSGGGSVLDSDLKLTKRTGIVYSNKNTTLEAPDVNLRDDELLIYDTASNTTDIFVVENINKYNDMLGQRVDYYYKYDSSSGDNVITMMTEKKNSFLTIDAADIEDANSSSTSVAYYENGEGKEKKASISSGAIAIYNRKLYGSKASNSTFSDYLDGEGGFPVLGRLELLDNNGDNVYDYVFIDSYEVYVVSSITSSSNVYTITDNITRAQPNHTASFNAKSDEVIFTDKNGSKLTVSSIKKGSVVCIKQTNESNGSDVITTIVICNDSVSGEVKGVSSGKSVKIGSTSYDFSSAAPWMRSDSAVSLAQPVMGDSGTYYLDLYGDVVAYDKAAVSSNQQYGYIIKAYVESKNMEDTLYLRVLTQSGSRKDYVGYEKTKVNGVEKDAEDILAALQDSARYQGQNAAATNMASTGNAAQLIKFTTKTYQGATVIDEILTATQGAPVSEITSDKLQMSNGFTAENANSSKYTASSATLKSGSSTANVKSSIIFSVPNDRSAEKSYKTVSYGSTLVDTETYTVEVYDHTQANTAKVIVMYNLDSTVGKVNNKTATFLITDIEEETNPNNDNEVMWKITGFKGKNTETSYVWISPSCTGAVAKLQKGDVVRFGEDSEGYATIDLADRLFGIGVDRDEVIATYASGGNLNGKEAGSGRYYLQKGAQNVTVHAIWGYVYACDDDSLVVLDKPLPVDTEEDVSTYQHSYSVSNISSALVVRYDSPSDFNSSTFKEDIIVKSEEKADVLKGLSAFAKGIEPAEIFIYDVDNYPTVVVIVQ